jgi:hypothetical protein
MADSSFALFCADFCKEAGARAPVFAGSADDPSGFELELDGIPITVLRVSGDGIEDVRVLIEYGAPAEPDEVATWQGLLDANFAMMGHFSLCFSRDPDTGDVMLQMRTPLESAAGAEVLRECRQLTDMAARWRRGELRIRAPKPSPKNDATPDPAAIA